MRSNACKFPRGYGIDARRQVRIVAVNTFACRKIGSRGTFLSTNGGNFQFSELNLTGALIDVGGHIEFVSGSNLSSVPLTPVPEPSTYALMLAGLGACGLLNRRRAKKG